MPTLCHCAASFNLFLYLVALGLHWCGGLSLVVVSGGYSLLQCPGFSLGWPFQLWSVGSRCMNFSSCGALAQ